MTKKAAEKNTHLVVRIDDETKKAFMEKVKSEKRVASALIMNFIESYLNDEHTEDVGDSAIARLEVELNELKSEFQLMKNQMSGKSVA
jgi:hypothetical protein